MRENDFARKRILNKAEPAGGGAAAGAGLDPSLGPLGNLGPTNIFIYIFSGYFKN